MADPTSEQQRKKEKASAASDGPQYEHIDEAAGGADSSPAETQPSGEKAETLDERQTKNKNVQP